MADVEPGQTFETAMLSPCVGGLVRTWTEGGSRLWAVDNPAALASAMGRGVIARTVREEHRYREVALLEEGSGLLLLQPRRAAVTDDGSLQFSAQSVRLSEAGRPSATTTSDLLELLANAVRHTVETNGFLVVERGGWDAPEEPYCLFIIVPDGGGTSMVETAPAPHGARFWSGHVQPGAPGATLTAPATPDSISAVPALIADACSTWGVAPWDLALTYGERPR